MKKWLYKKLAWRAWRCLSWIDSVGFWAEDRRAYAFENHCFMRKYRYRFFKWITHRAFVAHKIVSRANFSKVNNEKFSGFTRAFQR